MHWWPSWPISRGATAEKILQGMIADTPEPPCYAVIFTSVRNPVESDDYAKAAARMLELAVDQPGFLGLESARDGGTGISVSCWRSRQDIAARRQNIEHREARRQANRWYKAYRIRICRVEKACGS